MTIDSPIAELAKHRPLGKRVSEADYWEIRNLVIAELVGRAEVNAQLYGKPSSWDIFVGWLRAHEIKLPKV